MINALPSVGTDPVVGLKTLCDQHPGKVVFTTSMGLEDQALTDLIARNELPCVWSPWTQGACSKRPTT